jgi:D-alanyl-D-alanine carboxypeptidase
MIPRAALEHLDRTVERRMAEARTPGLALAVTHRQATLHLATFGTAVPEARQPVTADTLYSIGSVGKAFGAVAALQAYEAGLLDLHAPLAAVLPWFKVQSSFAPITAHHLLTHTSGLVHGNDLAPDARAIAWALRETETGFPPGERCHYSDAGYKLLGLALEAAAGRPYTELLRTGILEPLGMAATAPALTHDVRPRMARGYAPLYDDRPAHPSHPLVPAPWVETDSADGAVATTAGDAARFLRALLNGGRGPAGPIFSPESYRLMTRPWIEGDDSIWGHAGYGLYVFQRRGSAMVGHGGDTPGYEAYLVADLDRGIGVALLAAQPYPPGLIRAVLDVVQAALAGEPLPPLPVPHDPAEIENAGAYAGCYGDGKDVLSLRARGRRLLLALDGGEVALEARGRDRFYVEHPRFDRHLLSFGRDEAGRVVAAWHGAGWYAAKGAHFPPAPEVPDEWRAYPGHYRSFSPWESNFRVLLRRGRLLLAWPEGDEEPLVPAGPATFRVGDEPWLPERLRFGPVVDGQAWSANLSGGEYGRTFTP